VNAVKSKWEKAERLLPYLVLLAAYLISVGIFAYAGCENLNSDMSSEMVLADLLNQEGKLISKNWFYSTELRVVSMVPVYQLGLLLFDSWKLARIFSVAVILAGLAASYVYLMRSLGFGRSTIYYSAGLLLPTSLYSMFLMVYGLCYTVYIIVIFMLLAIIVRMEQGRFNKALGFILLFTISLLNGLNGVRMLMMFAAPLGLAASILLFKRIVGCKSLREAFRTSEMAYMLGTIVICAGLLVGYLISAGVLSKVYHFKSFEETLLYELNWEEVFRQINYLPYYFGFVNRQGLISFNGLVNASAIGIVFVSVLCMVSLVLKERELAPEQRLFIWFSVCSLVLGIVLNSMMRYAQLGGGAYTVSYYMPGVLLLAAMAYIAVDRMKVNLKGLKTVVLLAMTSVFFLQAVRYIRSDFRIGDADYRKTANYLVENGYTNGFATFWNANVMTEATDGKLDVYTYGSWNDTELWGGLQKMEHFEKLPEGKVFVLVDYEESLAHPAIAREENFLCETYTGYLYVYDSAQEVVDIQSSQMQN